MSATKTKSVKKAKKLVNHIGFVLDGSSSMTESRLVEPVKTVFSSTLDHLVKLSADFKQETRVTVSVFADTVRFLCVEVTPLEAQRAVLNNYSAHGWTALRDGIIYTLDKMLEHGNPKDDNSYVVYGITDGEENRSRTNAVDFTRRLSSAPEHVSVALMVPDTRGYSHAKNCGFPEGNIKIWETSERGLREAGDAVHASTTAYFSGRSRGIVGSRSLFQADLSAVKSTDVRSSMEVLEGGQFQIVTVAPRKDSTRIDEFCEENFGTYIKGAAFYQLIKPETIQGFKKICLQNIVSGKVYCGTEQARELLELPVGDMRLKPGDLGKFNVFVQSTSFNRSLKAGQKLLWIPSQAMVVAP